MNTLLQKRGKWFMTPRHSDARNIRTLYPARRRLFFRTGKSASGRSGAAPTLMLELPFTFACAPSSRFAYGAVSTLLATGVVTDIAFGVDTDDTDAQGNFPQKTSRTIPLRRSSSRRTFRRSVICGSQSFCDLLGIRRGIKKICSQPRTRYSP